MSWTILYTDINSCSLRCSAAMPRPKWIGSFSTKTIALERDDIEVVSVDLNNLIPQARILLHCDAVRAGHVVFQIRLNAMQWVSQPGVPPFNTFDLGVMGHPQAPVQLFHAIAPAGHSFYPVNWTHNICFEITPQQPHLRFRYQPPPKNGQVFPPIFFRRLRFIQQIQTALLAEHIQ